MSGTPTIPCNFTLLVGPDGNQPIFFEFDPIDVNSTIAVPDPIVTQSSSNSDADIDLKVEPLSVSSDSKSEIDSRSEIDLKPVAVDSCTTIKLAPLPPTCIEQPYSQHVGFTFMGVELFGFHTSGRYDAFLNKPSPPAAHGKRHEHHEHRDRLTPPTVVGRPRGITVRVIDD
jgi:hypothetical protein